MKYSINIPESELSSGWFNLFLKYTTYFIVSWFVGWIVLLFNTTDREHENSGVGDYITDNPGIFSALIALCVIGFLVLRLHNKFKLGQLISIEYNNSSGELKLELSNTFNGKIWYAVIPLSKLEIIFEEKPSELFGKQRIISFYNKSNLVTKVNIDLSAWTRHPEIDHLINELQSLKG